MIANVLDCGILVSELRYYGYFRIKPLNPPHQLLIKCFHFCSPTKIILILIHPRRLIYHETKGPNKTKLFPSTTTGGVLVV